MTLFCSVKKVLVTTHVSLTLSNMINKVFCFSAGMTNRLSIYHIQGDEIWNLLWNSLLKVNFDEVVVINTIFSWYVLSRRSVRFSQRCNMSSDPMYGRSSS